MVIITQKKTKPRSENDFYPTPYRLARAICDKFIVQEPDFVLDPGMGDGVFGLALRDSCREKYGFIDTEEHPEFGIDGIDIVRRPMTGNGAWIYSNEYIQNYLTFDAPIQYDLVIGNPPYSLAEQFVRKSFQVTSKKGTIIFLLKLAFLESKTRCRGLFKELPPTEVNVLAGRPSFDGSGRTNDYAFAVFVWDKEEMMFSKETKLFWFDWS
jgi:hypothetical protein